VCVCLTSNKPFYFGAEPDHDRDAGIFNEIFTTAAKGNVGILRDQLPLIGEGCGVSSVHKLTAE